MNKGINIVDTSAHLNTDSSFHSDHVALCIVSAPSSPPPPPPPQDLTLTSTYVKDNVRWNDKSNRHHHHHLTH